MPTLLIDMPSGVAGDMLLAALLACGGNHAQLVNDLAGLGLGTMVIDPTPVQPGGLAALHVAVQVPQEAGWEPTFTLGEQAAIADAGHGHRPYRVIRDLLERATVPERETQPGLGYERALAQ